MGGDQPGLSAVTGPDGLELAGIAGHQGGDTGQLGPSSQQGLLGLCLEPPPEDEDGNRHSRHGGNHQAADGGQHCEDDRGNGACHQSRQDWHGDPHLRVHDVGEVIDNPGQQVGSAATAQSGRCQWDEPFVCRGTPVSEVGQRGVVRAQALPVAKGGTGHTERAHGHDRGQQQEDGRAFAGTHDQPARGGRQGDT